MVSIFPESSDFFHGTNVHLFFVDHLQDINAVYKKMALELHPDKGGDPEKFQELQEMKAAGPAGLGLLGWGRCASFLLNPFWSFLWDGDDDDEEESWTVIHLSHSGSSFSTPLQERLTEIEKEEGDGEKKDTVDDPEEEDRAPFFKTKSKVIRWKPTCNPHHVRWVWGFEVVLFSRKIHHGG